MGAYAASSPLYDVIIAGGAMTGATLALAIQSLSFRPLSIAVVEATSPDDNHPGYDARSIALAYGSCQLLDKIGVWSSLASLATPIYSIHVSDKGHFGLTEIQAKGTHLPYLGNVVELADAGYVFYQHLEDIDNIDLYCPAKVRQIHREESKVHVTLNTGDLLEGKLLVAADGAISACCELLNIDRTEHAFNQTAIIANITTERAHQGRAFERFTQHGPIALLPMSDARSSLVWCLPPSEASKMMKLSDDAFLEVLQTEFGWRLGKLEKTGQRYTYPLILRQSAQLISHRFAVVGNAAQTLHPIAGQGFNLGLRDVMSLAEEIITDNLQDCGSMPVLQRYLQRREPDRKATVAMTSSLVHGFSNHALPIILGRNLGLIAMNAHSGLKTPIIQRALGLVQR